MWVENPDVEVGFLKGTTPDTVRGDVEAGSCLGVSCGSCQYFVGHRLKFELGAQLVAHFGEEGGCQIPCLIVPDRSFGTGQSMRNQRGQQSAGFSISNAVVLAKSPFYFSSACCTKLLVSHTSHLVTCRATIVEADTWTAHRPITVTLAAHAHRGLIKKSTKESAKERKTREMGTN